MQASDGFVSGMDPQKCTVLRVTPETATLQV